MASNTIPLAVPEELGNELRQTAADTGLSMADVMRQAMRLGLPLVRKGLSRKENSSSMADTGKKRERLLKCRLAKEDGFTVAVPGQPINEKAIEELLADFP